MEGRLISTDATIDYVEFHLIPSHNRYEASVYSTNRKENVASGQLEQLLLHSPKIRDLSSEGSNTKFKILRPENVNDVDWFTTATLRRFLHIIGLPDILSVGKEISQLAETKKFQLTLSNKAEADITSIESKNELLLAVDLRLTALKEELAAAFNQAIGCKCLPKDISDLGNFALHFGANDLKDSLHLLTEEDLTLSSEEDAPFVERSRGLTRSLTPRRPASPVRRIQIGRYGSRKAAALSIKSINYFSAKDKSMPQRDAAGNSSEEEDSQRPPKNNVLKMSVQDKISLFESKQKDQGVDIQKTKTTVGVKKSVHKRWSTETGASTEVSPPSSPNNVAPIAITEPDNNVNKTESCAEKSENMSFLPEKGALEQLRVEVNILEHENEWSQQKGEELNELCQKLMESKAVRHQNTTSDNSNNKKPKEQRVGFYDLYKKKKEEKLRGEASGEIIEKEAKMVFPKVSGANRRHAVANERQKAQKSSTQLINPKTTKPSPVKKTTSKPSPSPAARKSWSSTPSPKSARASPAMSPIGPASTNSTPTNRKPVTAAKAEKSQPRLKTLKATQADSNKTTKAIHEKIQPAVTENKTMTKANIQSPKTDTTVTSKPSFYNKVTRKNSVVPVETKPFLRKGSGNGSGVGPVIKTKGVARKTEENKVITMIDITSQNQGNNCQPTENRVSLDLEPLVISLSPAKYEESESGGHGSRTEASEINSTTEEELGISSSAWVVDEEPHWDEIIPCKESPIKLSSPANVTPPAEFSRPRVRHSLSQMLFEESNEADIGVWGNAEHPPTMIYQKDAPRGLKRLLKFARKAKAESHLTGWSSPSAVSEGDDDAVESRGLSNFSRFSVQNHQRVPEDHVFASINTTKATRSFFSLSAFRGNKTNEPKLLHR